MLKLNLDLLKSHVRQYGGPLYEVQQSAGVIQPSDYSFNAEDGTIKVEDDGKAMYIPVRQATLDAGFNGTEPCEISIFVALRDADGEFNGKPWSITKGSTKAFAH